jgi:hypothetical protein
VPLFVPERHKEIPQRRVVLPPDLRVDPAYAINSPMWDDYLQHETEKWRVMGFLGD